MNYQQINTHIMVNRFYLICLHILGNNIENVRFLYIIYQIQDKKIGNSIANYNGKENFQLICALTPLS